MSSQWNHSMLKKNYKYNENDAHRFLLLFASRFYPAIQPAGKAMTCLSCTCSEVGCWVWRILKSIFLQWKKHLLSWRKQTRAEHLQVTLAFTVAFASIAYQGISTLWQNPLKKQNRFKSWSKCTQLTSCCRLLICLSNLEME